MFRSDNQIVAPSIGEPLNSEIFLFTLKKQIRNFMELMLESKLTLQKRSFGL